MIASPLAAVVLSYTLAGRLRAIIFWVETCAVWAFSVYWIVKTGEMHVSSAERRALDAELKREAVPTIGAGTSARGAIARMLSPKSGAVERIVPADSSPPAMPPASAGSRPLVRS